LRCTRIHIYQLQPTTNCYKLSVVVSPHFRTPVAKGLDIMQGLRGHTTGYAVPTYVIDAPGGGGKIPLYPAAVVRQDGNALVLKNYEGHVYQYPDTAAIPHVAVASAPR
jgi:lysine 2,3-aminomutase